MARADEDMTPEEVAAELQRRECCLYHAINLPDFRTYVDLGALVSRKKLVDSGLGTPFVSDKTDEQRGLLDRCFGNLADFGVRFWQREEAPPNVYGPILLVFKPAVFGAAKDAAVAVKNAGSYDFDLERDRVVDRAELRGLFASPDGPQVVPSRFYCEFSTSTNSLSFDHLERIVVEPIDFYTVGLQDVVTGIVAGRWQVVEREASPLLEKRRLLNALAEWSAYRGGTPPGPMEEPWPGVGDWWKKAKPHGAAFRWFQYIVSTLKDLDADEVAKPAPEPPRCVICESYARMQCSGCDRWLCFGDYFGMDADGRFDANAQGRCWECCNDPT